MQKEVVKQEVTKKEVTTGVVYLIPLFLRLKIFIYQRVAVWKIISILAPALGYSELLPLLLEQPQATHTFLYYS